MREREREGGGDSSLLNFFFSLLLKVESLIDVITFAWT